MADRPGDDGGRGDGAAGLLAARLAEAGSVLLGRSLAVRHVDAGSCGGCEISLRGARVLREGLTRFGISMVDDPREADVLLVTGVATATLADAVRRTLEAMAPPRFVVAVGDCALDGGVFKGAPNVVGGAERVVTVDLLIAGCPPSPGRIIAGLVALVEANAPPVKRRSRIEPHA
ncbi:NADH-quinone oxidoreductase subunit B family protein [Acidiphilium acidophilum]|uniref:Hydrogenase n=1 Tax=Acidiphilium acidophilum TaxID=76588 RepID=A0AAW9DP13_ACIAO|nr:hydrogenase [Acidiphilium acidophilum]MDX5930914.1 hydrogenase [Acidiphilium acidophilum]